MNKKKALEPLIATILLIVVAVILVTIVLAWGKNFSTSSLDKTADLTNDACSAATIALSDCDYNTTTGAVTFYLKNTSTTHSFPADDFLLNVIDSDDATAAVLDLDLNAVALTPGQKIIESYPSTVTGATKVNISVRSTTCPGIATAELRYCQ